MSHIEFVIGRVKKDGNCALVDGRVENADPIRVRDTFTAVRPYTVRRDENGWLEVVHGPAEPVHLTVESIQMYQQMMEFTSPGMTARLLVRGDGLERIGEQMTLSG